MSELTGNFIEMASGTTPDTIAPADFDVFITKAASIDGCTL